MFSLNNGDEVIQGTEELLNHATEYYKNLFGPPDGFTCRLRSNVWAAAEKLSDEDNAELCKHFSEEEVKRVVMV